MFKMHEGETYTYWQWFVVLEIIFGYTLSIVQWLVKYRGYVTVTK
jgi:hypothetical protein